jgi:two-component system sensor histidine kinase AlgZ
MDPQPDRTASKYHLRRQFLLNNLSALIVPILVVIFVPKYGWSSAWKTFIYSVLFANIIGTLACVVMPKVWPLVAGRRSVAKWSIAAVALMLIAFVGCTLASTLLLLMGFSTYDTFLHDYKTSLELSILITLIFGIAATAYETLRHQLEQTTLELRTKELERERALKLATEARLSSLESRLHPHFLFNTLNSVSSLIREDPQQAERLIERMAALLRFSLDSTQAGSVAVEKEMKIVGDYLEIEKARFGDRLRYEIHMPSNTNGVEVPPLTIQTLVENSVKYAVASRREGGFIRINGQMVDSRIHIEVSDDGPGFGVDSLLPGHGLDNLQSRLLALYGMDAALALARGEHGMSVTVSVPLSRAAVRT